MADQIQLDKKVSLKTRRSVWLRSQFLQASWNYERMQNLGWCFALIPALKELYGHDHELTRQALKRHLEFFNTHPYLAAPIFGVEMSLEEKRAAGADVDDAAIQGVKIGMMGPLAGVGDPIFWGTIRPVLGAFSASLALSSNIMGPILFFVIWNAIRLGFLWFTQELGYQQGENLTKDLSGGFMRKVTLGASVLGMFIMGVLIPRWTSMPMNHVVFAKDTAIGLAADSYPALDKLYTSVTEGKDLTIAEFTSGLRSVSGIASTDKIMDGEYNGEKAHVVARTTTLQDVLDQLLPGLLPLALTFICLYLLRHKVNPIVIIFALFVVGILGALIGLF